MITTNDTSVVKLSKFRDAVNDPAFLVAKGVFHGTSEEKTKKEKTHVNQLSNAILTTIANHGHVNVRTIGKSATANAVKAITIATATCALNGIKLYWESVFDKGNLGKMENESHVQDVSAVVFKVSKWEDVQEKL